MEKKLTTSDNLELFYYPNRATHSFCLSLYMKAGCIYESEKDNGITHFLEHLIFRSINRRMNGEMYRILDRLGLYFNGATYKELIQLYIVGAPAHFEEAAEILLKVFSPLALTKEDFKTEQQRVKAEIREAEEFKSLDYFAGTFAWQGTPAKNTILGTKGNISRFSARRMEEYRSEILQGGNAFFYVTGNVTPEQMEFLRDSTDAAGSGKKREILDMCTSVTGNRSNCIMLPSDFGCRPLTVHVKNSTYSLVQFSFDLTEENCLGPELNLLYDILFSGENGLIHQELSEKRGWVYSISSVLEKYNNGGRIYFTYEIDKKYLPASVELVAESLSSLDDEGHIAERLQYVLAEYVDNGWMIYDDNENFNWQRAYEGHIMHWLPEDIEKTGRLYKSVTPARLRRIVSRVFRLQNLVLSVKGKKSQVDTYAVAEILRSSGLNRK